MYDSLVDKSEGYAGPVPAPHKTDVMSEVISLLNMDVDESEIEGF